MPAGSRQPNRHITWTTPHVHGPGAIGIGPDGGQVLAQVRPGQVDSQASVDCRQIGGVGTRVLLKTIGA